MSETMTPTLTVSVFSDTQFEPCEFWVCKPARAAATLPRGLQQGLQELTSGQIELCKAFLARISRDFVAPIVMPTSSAICFIELSDRRRISNTRR